VVKEDIELLPALRHAIVSRVGQHRFDLWFGTNTQLDLEEGRLVIQSTHREFLRKNFHVALRQALEDVGCTDLEIVYREGETKKPNSMPAVVPSTSPNVEVAQPKQRLARRRFSSLDDFVVSSCNSMAKTAATMVLSQPGQISPLYIHGSSGTGKTHLLEGIYGLAQKQKTFHRVVYLSAEQFTTYFLEALQSSGVANFRHKYRDVGLLIIDDVQFFAGKRATKTELLHTMDAITRRGGQVILGANQRPTELSALGTELVARFSSGLICKIDELDSTCRESMIRRLAEKRDVTLTPTAIDWLTRNVPGEGRILSGVINRLWAYQAVEQTSLSADTLEDILADLIPKRNTMLRLDDVEHAVCRVFKIDAKLLRSSSKARRASHPRMLAMWLARKYTGAALSDICQHFQRRSHSTVISAEKKVNSWLEEASIVQFADQSIAAKEAIELVKAELRVG